MRAAFICSIGMALMAGPALAADDINIVSLDSPAAHNAGWSGIYVGATAGYGWLRDVDYQFTPPLESKGDDWIFGAHAGYLHQWGSWVAGVEGDYSILNIQFDGFPITVDEAATLRVRAGFAHQKFLISAHAGATYATTNINLADWGYNIGAAVEYMVSDNIIAGLQYDHHNFKRFDNTLIDAQLNLLKLRVSYKF